MMNWCKSCINRGNDKCVECEMSIHCVPSMFKRRIETVEDRISNFADLIFINKSNPYLCYGDCHLLAESLHALYPSDMISFSKLKQAAIRISEEREDRCLSVGEILSLAFYEVITEQEENE